MPPVKRLGQGDVYKRQELPTVQLEQRIKQEIEDNIVLEEEEHASEEEEQPQPVSYTHLDVYKRQGVDVDYAAHRIAAVERALRSAEYFDAFGVGQFRVRCV